MCHTHSGFDIHLNGLRNVPEHIKSSASTSFSLHQTAWNYTMRFGGSKRAVFAKCVWDAINNYWHHHVMQVQHMRCRKHARNVSFPHSVPVCTSPQTYQLETLGQCDDPKNYHNFLIVMKHASIAVIKT